MVAWLLISQHKWLYITSYPCPWIKILSAKTTKYILKYWERSVKTKSNLRVFLTLSMLIYYNTSNFSEKFLTDALPAGLFCSLSIKVLSVSEHNFFILKFHCIMLLLNFITSKYSLFRQSGGLFRNATSISRYVWLVLGSFLINISSTSP